MATTSAITQPSTMDHFTSKLRDYYTLAKPEVNMLILMEICGLRETGAHYPDVEILPETLASWFLPRADENLPAIPQGLMGSGLVRVRHGVRSSPSTCPGE